MLAIAKLIIICENTAIRDKNLTSARYTKYGLSRFQHLVGLHHAMVSEVSVVLIILAAPRE